ncbi:MAG: hypothetical protein CVV30_04965 [Methanomicrobiales archaeon HGW-Methanomicrobiales-1]|jgi:uncharacterized protein (UPF0305 family)|nr:MAG: hypothetical protein CVV30_04965 [Methanomicrobiales archaeon HGW-Methanomicrobiales-1]
MLTGHHTENLPSITEQIRSDLQEIRSTRTRGELGTIISTIVLRYSPKDIEQMRRNFKEKIRDVTPEYRDRLQEKITEHLLGTWQTLRLMHQQGAFAPMNEPVPKEVDAYWAMVATQCGGGSAGEGDDIRLRFLKFLIAGFCMFVQHEPGHPVGTPFPGGDMVQYIDGVYYCPVREKANDVDAALCPFCPARQSPEIGYLKPPVNGSEHRKQEFIRHCHDFHNFNG